MGQIYKLFFIRPKIDIFIPFYQFFITFDSSQ